MKLNAQTVQVINSAARSSVAETVLSQVGAFTRAVAGSPLLARTLAQADLPEANKVALVNDVVGNRFDSQSVDVIVSGASSAPKSTFVARTLFDALTELAFATREAGNSLEKLEQQLLDMADIVTNSDELRDAFSNPGVADEAKIKVLNELLGSRTPSDLRELSLCAIAITHGRGVDSLLRERAELAAKRRNSSIAVIRSAVELDDARKTNLVNALSQSVGRPVVGRFVVDPAVIGSLVVRIGDEVLDGSVRHRLQQARLALVGAQ